MTTQIRSLLDLPRDVRKGDFVLGLTEGISQPEKTVKDYAITPSLVHAFDRALSIINSGLSSKRSQASYLHGSFGSGKSHFMAILDLMLVGHPAPWARPQLHALRAKYDWAGSAKVLQVPLHMIGAESTEQKIFSAYVDKIKELHPAATIPALYADQALFDDAEHIRESVGDETFFGKLNEASGGGASKWGKRATAWDANRFASTVVSNDKSDREALFSALAKTFFKSFTGQTHRFVGLDEGLGVVGRHAASLGYQAVVLYLDELILWLAGKVGNLTFVQDEAQKLAKLKEAQDENREIPIVSFIARQRDLGDLVGAQAAGEVMTTLRDSLAWSKGRFETIVLEDRNLPAVVEHRVVRPKDEAARQTILDQMPRIRRSLGNAWGTVLGAHGTEDDFKKVYPFSPALIDALVAVSDCLQRERTAIRVLMELLVKHLTDLELGQVVPVGDIFDVLAGGDDAFDALMQDRFNRAKDLYRNHFLPLIQRDHDTSTPEACQRLRSEHPVSLGCSACPQTACRNDNRLAKTLLLAAFVPNAGPFKNFTVTKLVQLNHGTVVTPIPGTEASTAATKLRNWATQVGQLRIGEQNDPEISVRLEGVDLQPIIEQAMEADTPGNRRRLLQNMLWDALGLSYDGSSLVRQIQPWRGTKRTGQIRFGNVRQLPDSAFSCPADADWSLIIDYPFDEPGFGPDDDHRRLDDMRDKQGGQSNPTFVWLPSFFSDKVERELGQFAIIDHILTGDNAKKYLGHLRTEDQARARVDLESLRSQKRALIRRSLEQAYALTSKQEGDIDPARSVEEPIVSLQPKLKGRPVLAASFADALSQLVDRLMEHQYPHHPRFSSQGTVTTAKLEKVRVLFDKILDSPDHKIPVDKSEQRELRDIAEHLGLVKLHETVAHLQANRLKEVEQKRSQAAVDTPTAEQVRAYVDPQQTFGLTREVSDLMVYAYASWSGRSLERGGQPYEMHKVGKLDDDVEIRRPDLPTEQEWHSAIEAAGRLFGIAQPGRALNARNLNEFSKRLIESASKHGSARRLEDALRRRMTDWVDDLNDAPRLLTAGSGLKLLGALDRARPVEQVRALASFEAQTSATALQCSLRDAEKLLRELSHSAVWVSFDAMEKLRHTEGKSGRAQEILDELRDTLRSDQVNSDLVSTLADLTRRAGDLVREQTVHVPPATPSGRDAIVERYSVDGPASELATAISAKVAEALSRLGDDQVSIEVTLHITKNDDESEG